MNWEDLEKEFEVDIPDDLPVFPMNVVCELLDMQYYLLHEIVKEGLLASPKKAKHKKLFSQNQVKRLKYIQYLIHEKGVNINGVKIILEMESEE